MSELYQSLSHSKWDCKYHVVFVPKRRRKAILARRAGNWVRSFTRWPGEKNARLSRVIRCRTMCIRASPFPPNTRWHR